MRYIKNGKISDGSYVFTSDGKHIINPTHDMMIKDGWQVCQDISESNISRKHKEIEILKKELASTDYKITKIAEAISIGAELPYDAQEIHEERQKIRDRINQLEMEVQGGEDEQ